MTELPFFGYSLYQMFHMFCIWAFIGWCIEVCYMTLETGEYQNRGFLNMPICPIYGFGVLMVVIFFRPLENTFLLLFAATSLLCTTFELLVGLGMEKLFNTRWWDYSNERFNFKGYICLKVSLLWGFGCVIVVRIVHPMIERLIDLVPVKVGMVLLVIISVLILIDLIASICAVNNLNNRLKQIDEISSLMLKSSIKIGEKLANETNEIREKYDRLGESKAAVEIREKYDRLMDLRDAQVERLIKAFPNIRSLSYSESMDKLKARVNSYKRLARIKKNAKEREQQGENEQ
ncbi:MAG: putative ABC transporter permease [Oscillospiraceae bacterium]